MFRKISLVILGLTSIAVNAQYKNDNVLFKTVDPADICVTLENNKGYLLLDVRSKGEHYDTSQSPSYNLGKFKGAKNIDVRELGQRLSELQDYKDKPIFVYCSHSQRSRRASKMLADSGFTKVYNINGGMTAIHYNGKIGKNCIADLLETMNNYNIISAAELCEKIKVKGREPYIVDVRPDSAWNRTGSNPKENAYGSINGAVHLSLDSFSERMSMIPKSRQEVIITDIYGDRASQAGVLLKQRGYDNVSVLIEGVDRVLLTDANDLPCKSEIYKPAATYRLLNVSEFARSYDAAKNPLVIDLRSSDEYNNKHKDAWRNIGRIRKATHIPHTELANRISDIDKYKNREVYLYAFGSSPEVFTAANTLQQQGFKNVNVVIGGLFNLRWTAANRKGQSALKDLVVDVPEENK